MPISVYHQLTATTPDNTSYEIKPSNWNADHVGTISAAGSEIFGAFSNANNVSFGLSNGFVTATAAVGMIISAGAGASSLSNLVFSNANGVSFGLIGSTITASAPSTAGLISGIGLSAGNQNSTVTGFTASNANNVSFGLQNGVLTASASFLPPNNGINGVVAGTQLLTSGTLSFSNLNGISFGLNGSTLTASYTVPSQSVQTFGMTAEGFTTGVTSTTNAGNGIIVSGAGVASVGFGAGGAIVVSVAGGTGTGVGIAAGGSTQSTGVVQFSNANGVTFGLNAGTLTATVNPGPAAGIGAVSAGTQLQTTGTLNFVNSNGMTFGMSNSSQLTASYTVPSTAGLISSVVVSAGTTSGSATGLTFSNSNGLSFGLNNGTITGSYTVPSQTAQPVAASGSNGSFAFSTLSFGSINGATFYTSNGSMALSYTVPSTAGLLSALNVSAGAAASNVQSLVFSNSNNVSFGLNGQTITASVPNFLSQVSAGTQVNSPLAGLTFSNSNGVSFGLNNGTITASVVAGGAGGVALSAGTQSANTGTVTFVNSNGISFGMSNSNQITAQYTVPNTAGLISGVAVSAGTQSTNNSSFVFSNSNGVSFGLNNNTITASINPAIVASQAIYAIGNSTGQSSQSTGSLSSMNYSFAGMLSGGWSSNTFIFSAPATTALTLGGLAIGANTTQNTSASFNPASINVSGAGIISAGFTGNTLIISAPQTTQLTLLSAGVSTIGNSQGNTGLQGSQLVLAGTNGVTLSQSTNAAGATVYFSAGAGGGGGGAAVGISTQGNTAGTTGFLNSGSYQLAGFGAVSLSQATGAGGNTLSISAPATSSMSATGFLSLSTNGNTISIGAGPLSFLAVGNTTQSSSGTIDGRSISVNGAGIVSAGVTNGSLVISGPANIGIGGIQASNTTYTSGTVIFSNANGVSFGSSAGGAITASYTVPTVPALSLGVSTGGNTLGNTGIYSGQAVFQGSNNITLSVSTAAGQAQTIVISGPTVGGAQTGISGIIVSNTTYTSGTVSFSNANGISFGSSAGQAITASYTVPSTVGLISALRVSAGGGTSNNVTGITFANSNNVTFGLSTGASVGTMTGSFALNVSAPGGTSNALSGITFSNSNGVSFGLSTGAGVGTMTAQVATTAAYYFVGNTAGASSSSTGNDQTLSINMTGGISGGWTNGSLQLSAPATSSLVGTSGMSVSVNASTISLYNVPLSRLIYPQQNLTALGAGGQGSMSFQYVPIDSPVQASRLDALVGWSGSSTAASNTAGVALSVWGCVYTNNAGTLSSLYSGSTQTTYTYASNSAGVTGLTASAIRPISCPLNMSLSQGEYYVGFNFSTNSTSVGANTTNLGQTISMYGGNGLQSALNYAEFTANTASTSGLFGAMGVLSATTNAVPATVGVSNIVQTGASLSQANIGLVFRNV